MQAIDDARRGKQHGWFRHFWEPKCINAGACDVDYRTAGKEFQMELPQTFGEEVQHFYLKGDCDNILNRALSPSYSI